jgi:hypothetical protein
MSTKTPSAAKPARRSKVFTPPKSLAVCADTLYKLREAHYELQRKAKELEEQEGILREHLINHLPVSKATGISGKIANAKIELKPIVTVADWSKLEKYIVKNASKGAFALLQHRVNNSAVEEIWGAGKKVPGCERMQIKVISLTKR